MDELFEAYLAVYEAKVDRINPGMKSSSLNTALEVEDKRNRREFGTTSNRNRNTGVRRFFHDVSRGVKKERPSGNEPSEISGRFGTGAEVRREIRKLKARKEGRDIAKELKIKRDSENYIKQQNSQFNADSAENKIIKFQREELEYIIDILVSEGYVNDYDSAACILEAMSDEWLVGILEKFNPEDYKEYHKKNHREDNSSSRWDAEYKDYLDSKEDYRDKHNQARGVKKKKGLK
jgi:hypothetical protein